MTYAADQKARLTKALGTLHRKHRRTIFGNCRCGWRRNLLSVIDHSDHVARVMAAPMSMWYGLLK